MDNKYINIINGENIEMTDDKFAESYKPFEQFLSDFFKDREIKIENINKMTGNTTEFDFVFKKPEGIDFNVFRKSTIYILLKNIILILLFWDVHIIL